MNETITLEQFQKLLSISWISKEHIVTFFEYTPEKEYIRIDDKVDNEWDAVKNMYVAQVVYGNIRDQYGEEVLEVTSLIIVATQEKALAESYLAAVNGEGGEGVELPVLMVSRTEDDEMEGSDDGQG